MKAVITGDIIDSSKQPYEERTLIIKTLQDSIRYFEERDTCQYSIFRGDSIQGLLEQPEKALWHVVYLKSALKALKTKNASRSSFADIRISIGIGRVNFLHENLEMSNGEAFEYSGRKLDQLKGGAKTIAIKSRDEGYNEEWSVVLGLMDEVLGKWSVQSAEIVKNILEGHDKPTIGRHLNISLPAISQRKKYAGWNAIQAVMNRFEKMTKSTFKENV